MQQLEATLAELEAEGAKADQKRGQEGTQGDREAAQDRLDESDWPTTSSSTWDRGAGDLQEARRPQAADPGRTRSTKNMRDRYRRATSPAHMGAEAVKRAARRPSTSLRSPRSCGRADHRRQGSEEAARNQATEGRRRRCADQQPPGRDGARCRPGDPAGAAPDGPARRWPVRHLRPQRPLPPRDQPQQPAQAPARPRRARDHRQQREADAAGGRRRAVRQRPSRSSGHRSGQPAAEVAVRHAQGQAGPVPSEPAGQARGLLRSFGHRRRSAAQACTSAACPSSWHWSCSSPSS
jgi:hypothetical protein